MTELTTANGGGQSAHQGSRTVVVAIDGPAGAGKSTAARLLAKRLGFFLLDSGALYRAMAMHLLRGGVSPDGNPVPQEILKSFSLRIEPGIATMRLFLGNEEVTQAIRKEAAGVAASVFSARPEVREALIGVQRSAGRNWNLVAEGRDMGSVVFPEATVKFFLNADLSERAKRRFAELRERGDEAELERVKSEMDARDQRDRTRHDAPLIVASDALCIDSTHLGPEQVVDRMLELIREKLGDDPGL